MNRQSEFVLNEEATRQNLLGHRANVIYETEDSIFWGFLLIMGFSKQHRFSVSSFVIHFKMLEQLIKFILPVLHQSVTPSTK